MKGFVPTPEHVVDAMVQTLFRGRRPTAADRVLDPGCGTGAFIEGILRWCKREGCEVPSVVGVDSDKDLLDVARKRVGAHHKVQLRHEDFLLTHAGDFDFVVGNPPYVAITGLSVSERAEYRMRFESARGRFDLYLLFFEQALRCLQDGGRMVFITPEKFAYVQSASLARRILAAAGIESIEQLPESTFDGLVTYPAVTTVQKGLRKPTAVRLRDGTQRLADLSDSGRSWLAAFNGSHESSSAATLATVCDRISCGIATGADNVFVVPTSSVPRALSPFALPTISGRNIILGSAPTSNESILVPYERNGKLLEEGKLGALEAHLREPSRLQQLLRRTCVSTKPWYAFHETPPLTQVLRPKILCKDIGPRPGFVIDHSGELLPRHSVYYLIPRDPSRLVELCEYLNSPTAQEWLVANCQRAANGFVRLQSHVLKRLPVPDELLPEPQLAVG